MDVDNTPQQIEPVYQDIDADTSGVTEIESLCMNCHEQGTTRLLLTRIPYFKEIVLSSFECPHCYHKNTEIQPSGNIQEMGIRIKLNVTGKEDLDRQVVRQASATFRIEELGFEAPPFTTKGALTTLEGMILNAITGLNQQQPVRKIMTPDVAAKIDVIIEKLEQLRLGATPFTFVLEDCTGNSFMENPHAPRADPNMQIGFYKRSKEENEKLGISLPDDDLDNDADLLHQHLEDLAVKNDNFNVKEEVMEFPTNCERCHQPCITKMKLVDIPHFKEAIIMATTCDNCGWRTNEVKAGGAMEDYGVKTSLKITDALDLSRDLLKSETCELSIPELDFSLQYSSMGGRFTTVEGILVNLKEEIGKISPFSMGDSAGDERKRKFQELKDNLDKIINGELQVTLVLDDPVGNSHIQNIYAPDPDPNLTVEKYTRTAEQDEELGISDMVTENYSS